MTAGSGTQDSGMSEAAQGLWSAYLRTLDDAESAAGRLYDVFRIGDSPSSADEGARLVLAGRKTATSALLWDFEASGTPPPEIGALSILENGRGEPVCIVETTWVEILTFAEIDEAFALDYGEWGGTLESWLREAWDYYAGACRDLGRDPAQDMPLVCERFRVVYRA